MTPEELNLIIKYLPETALLVIPKVSRQELRETIDRQANKTTNCTVNPIKARSEVEKFDQDALWSNGQVEENNNWRVVFTNGKSSGIYDADRQRSKSSYAQVAILNEYYSSLGIRALSGAKDYMTLLIQELARGYTIDEFGPVTILNASTVTSSTDTPLSAGNWNLRNGNLELSTFSREEHQWRIRLRAALEVNL